MLNNTKYIKNTGLFIIIVATLFFNFTTSHAQQYKIYGGYVTSDTSNNTYTSNSITTTNATNITPTTATLNALLNGSGVYNTYNLTTWFDYGTTVNLGTSSSGHSANFGYASYISNISGLNPNTVYYFRAMGQSPNGIIYGGINSFRTTIPQIPTVNTNPVINNTYTQPAPPKATITKIPAVTSKSQVTVTKEEKGQTQDTNTTGTSFFPITILGWILLIILILILILTIKHTHLKFSGKK